MVAGVDYGSVNSACFRRVLQDVFPRTRSLESSNHPSRAAIHPSFSLQHTSSMATIKQSALWLDATYYVLMRYSSDVSAKILWQPVPSRCCPSTIVDDQSNCSSHRGSVDAVLTILGTILLLRRTHRVFGVLKQSCIASAVYREACCSIRTS